ncbi:cHAP domain./Bacterial SH3 domain./Fibronectin type III domain [[Eubacterium] siraeum CAG:80]|uniref:CHAP domain./Bacterial SH3 domain./Fibronectin type III domain n=1 Tax=[Eubacterium] siraeum CAG:80 TaxID=1263080 RepID=R6RLD9_9FIRM|nr:cHAP domain./Bacterial SH3 domain./Fibronectin type III domain [[Eubacterium] siraeum CAG:80]
MKLKRTAAAVVAAVMAFTAVATPLGDNIPALEGAFSAGAYYSVKDSFYPVTLTGDGAVDMVNVAVAQNGRKDDDTGWYPSSEAWCADFVMDVARVAGQTGAVPVAPANAACGTFKNALLNAGAQMVTTAQAGDIVFYCGKYNGSTYHVGIMKDSRYAVEGNAYTDGIYKVNANRDTRVFYASDGNSIAGGGIYTVFIRPKYTNKRDKEAPNLTSLGEEDWNRNGMGFLVRANATDNVGVTKIAFTVSANGRTKDYQANLEKNNTCGWQYISVSDFSNFLGTYSISCAAYDACGNKSNVRSMTVTLDKGTAPTVADKTIKEGTYCLRNGVGLNMDVTGGTDENKNPAVFYEHNGSAAQRMKFIYKGNGKYLIAPECSTTGKVIDVYRPTDGDMDIDWGDKIDLYQNDDDEAQEFYVVPVGNGDYVLELASKDNFVIGGKHTFSGANFYLQPYLNFAPSQRFRFTDASGNAVDVCNHSYKETRTEPTCTAGGKLTKVCKYCGKKVEETINAPGHSWSGWSTTTYPTCTAQGVEQRTCSRCLKAETRYITALGHNYSSEWTIDKQATCSAEGSKSKHCTRCSSVTEVTAIPKTAHSYKTTVVAPTLTSQGYTVHECTVCHYSYKDSYTSQITLSAVTGVKVKTQGTTSLTLAWDKNASANGYVVEQYRGGKWTQITKTASNAVVSYTVNGLKADTTYTFRIKGYVVSGTTEYSSEYTRLAAKTRIANVGTFKGSAVSGSAIKLDWSKNDKASGYIIEQYKGGKWTALATTKNNTTLTFTVKGLASATVYSFRIKSFRTVNGKTDYSEYTSLKVATSFGGVNNLTVKSYTASAITLAWNKNASANGYVVEQYKGGKWTQIAKTSSNATVTYTVNGLKADTTYTFRVRAYKTAAGKTIYSEYTRLAAKTRIAKVASFRVTGTTTSAVELSWNKNAKATGYIIEIYRGGKWTAIATTKNNTTLRFTVKGLARNTTYSFRIKAFRKTGSTTEFSEYSGLKAATRK